MQNAGSTVNPNVGNIASNVSLQEMFYPVIMDNKAGIMIKFNESWSKTEYHEGRIIVYRSEDGRISVIEVEYDEES